MACCGGGTKNIRRQIIERPTKATKAPTVQRISRHKPATNKVEVQRVQSPNQRQAVLRDTKCPKCGYGVMLVDIAGRERRQCSNANCRLILK